MIRIHSANIMIGQTKGNVKLKSEMFSHKKLV